MRARKELIQMKLTCPKCKQVQEADEKTATCPNCRTVLRRCVDCNRYDVRLSVCKALNRPISTSDANYPTYSAPSTYCREYAPSTPPAA